MPELGLIVTDSTYKIIRLRFPFPWKKTKELATHVRIINESTAKVSSDCGLLQIWSPR